MNIPASVAGGLTLVALGAHAVVGGREFRHFAPPEGPGEARQAWVQALCGWHWVSVDLGASALLLLAIGLADVVPQEATVLGVLSGYFVLTGTAWCLTVALAGRGVARRFVALGQWLFCLLIAGLAFAAR